MEETTRISIQKRVMWMFSVSNDTYVDGHKIDRCRNWMKVCWMIGEWDEVAALRGEEDQEWEAQPAFRRLSPASKRQPSGGPQSCGAARRRKISRLWTIDEFATRDSLLSSGFILRFSSKRARLLEVLEIHGSRIVNSPWFFIGASSVLLVNCTVVIVFAMCASLFKT